MSFATEPLEAWNPIQAGVIAAPEAIAGSNNDGRNGRTVLPSVLVPSGNSTTGNPERNTSSMLSLNLAVSSFRSRSTKSVPDFAAIQPKIGHERTSFFAMNAHGTIE